MGGEPTCIDEKRLQRYVHQLNICWEPFCNLIQTNSLKMTDNRLFEF